MYLSLSARIVESSDPRPGVAEFARLAATTGYRAIGLRKWQLTPETTPNGLDEIVVELREADIRVSSISTVPDAVKAIAPMARALGVKTLRVSGPPAELAAATEFLDDDMRLGPQMHTGGEFENIKLAAEALDRIGAPKLGVIVEPANLRFAGEEWSRDVFAPLAGRIIGCNLQSIAAGSGEAAVTMRDGTKVPFKRVPAEENSQIDFPGFFAALHAVGYDGYVDVIEPASPVLTNDQIARSTAQYLRRVM